MLILLAFACFACMAALDYAVVRHQDAVRDRCGNVAGAWSIACYFAGLVATYCSIEVSLWLALPSAAGLFVGNRIALDSRGVSS